MPRYPKQPLEEKLAWMRERQRQKGEEAARQKEQELKQLNEEQAAATEQRMRLDETVRQAKLAGLDSLKSAPPCRAIPPARKMLRVDEVAEMLGMSVKTVQRWFRPYAVIVPTGPCKTTMLISQQALDDWFAEYGPKPR